MSHDPDSILEDIEATGSTSIVVKFRNVSVQYENLEFTHQKFEFKVLLFLLYTVVFLSCFVGEYNQ